ncbi:MAG TPA: EVE domain-containing protein [Vicinamibacteria bacterium]|jgi:predicted RNA-binding protein with PUA-like domain
MTANSYWLMKSEPDVYSIDDFARDRTTHWDGVRNFKARNYMRSMALGDGVFFYHSNADPKAIVGIARVSKLAYPDGTQFDKKSDYYEPKATSEKPYWYMVEIEFVRKLPEPQTLEKLREVKELSGMALLKKGQRLSVQPVTEGEWKTICSLAGVPEDV